MRQHKQLRSCTYSAPAAATAGGRTGGGGGSMDASFSIVALLHQDAAHGS